MKLAKGVGKFIVKAAKEAGEEAAEQGVKQIVKQSPKHVKKMAHMAVDEAGNVTKKAIKTVSENPEAWSKAKETIKDTTKKMWENKKNTWNEDFKRIQEMYNNKEFDLDEAREYIKGFYYKDLSPEKEEELVKTLESNRKKYNKNKNKESRRQQNKNNNQNQGRNQNNGFDMEQFKTADEINAEMNNGPETNNFNANDFNSNTDSNRTYQSGPKDPDARYTNVDRDGYTYQSKNGLADEIVDKETGNTYKFIRDDKGKVVGVKNVSDVNETVSNEMRGKLDDIAKYERHEMEKNFTDKEWDDAFREHFTYESSLDTEGNASSKTTKRANEADHYGYNSAEEVISRRKGILDEEIDEIENTIKGLDKKKDKDQIDELLERQKKLQSKKAGMEYREARLKDQEAHKKMSQELKDNFTKQVEGMDPTSDAFKEAMEEMNLHQEVLDQTLENSRRSLQDQTQGKVAAFMDDSNLMSKINKGLTAFTTVKSAVDKYKESRAEGKSVASSVVRGAGSAVTSSMLGFWGSMGVTAATVVPGAVIGATDYLLSEQRRMNSAANYTPLGGTSFQDSQQLATMRQSGMELAKMSRYNLEQTLMGAEAKHLHR
jgi:hypothetical protein